MTATATRFRILVVDDNEGDLFLFQESIRERNFPITVVTMKHAAEAIDHLSRDQQFDLILSDLNMPQMSGIEFIRALLDKPELRSIPTVLMSSNTSENISHQSLAHLSAPYFTKAHTWNEFSRFTQEVYAMLCENRIGKAK